MDFFRHAGFEVFTNGNIKSGQMATEAIARIAPWLPKNIPWFQEAH